MADARDEHASDFFTAKQAWEREHPGEVYTTARHYSRGPTARVLTDYWEQYVEESRLSCPACGWQGDNGEAVKELHEELFDLSCPRCEKMLLIVSYPTLEQTREAAERGNAEALEALESLRSE